MIDLAAVDSDQTTAPQPSKPTEVPPLIYVGKGISNEPRTDEEAMSKVEEKLRKKMTPQQASWVLSEGGMDELRQKLISRAKRSMQLTEVPSLPGPTGPSFPGPVTHAASGGRAYAGSNRLSQKAGLYAEAALPVYEKVARSKAPDDLVSTTAASLPGSQRLWVLGGLTLSGLVLATLLSD